MLGYLIRMVSTMAVGALILTGVWYMTDFAWQNIMFVGGTIMALICIGGGNGAMMAGSAVHSMSTADDIKTQNAITRQPSTPTLLAWCYSHSALSH